MWKKEWNFSFRGHFFFWMGVVGRGLKFLFFEFEFFVIVKLTISGISWIIEFFIQPNGFIFRNEFALELKLAEKSFFFK